MVNRNFLTNLLTFDINTLILMTDTFFTHLPMEVEGDRGPLFKGGRCFFNHLPL